MEPSLSKHKMQATIHMSTPGLAKRTPADPFSDPQQWRV